MLATFTLASGIELEDSALLVTRRQRTDNVWTEVLHSVRTKRLRPQEMTIPTGSVSGNEQGKGGWFSLHFHLRNFKSRNERALVCVRKVRFQVT